MGNATSNICTEMCNGMMNAIGRMLGYLIATIIFAAALVFTVAIVLMLALGSVFSLLIHDYISSSQQLLGIASFGILLLIPTIVRGANRDATLLDVSMALSGASLLMGCTAGLLGKYSLLLPLALCILFGVPLAVCWCHLCMTFPDWVKDCCCRVCPTLWRSTTASSQPLLQTEWMDSKAEALNMTEMMEAFFDQCVLCGKELLKRKPDLWLTRDDLEELMPDVIVGLPALALLRVIQETLARDHGRGFLLDKWLITDQNRPAVRGAAEAYRWALEAKKALAELQPSVEECLFIEARTMWEGIEAPAAPDFEEGLEVFAKCPLHCRSPGLAGLIGRRLPVASGCHGRVKGMVQHRVEVQWSAGLGLHAPHELLRKEEPRRLESAAAGEPQEGSRKQLAVQVAGRLRSVATFFTRMPFFQQNFRGRVVESLLKGYDQWRFGASSPVRSPPLLSHATGALAAACACEIARLRSEE
ncbi:unnamed protein product [Durusdinium trenchii]|uniref:Uncharacterized protein n=2 Tax=Durusdinium trenchii TaxID=1381693 RepID=A0ABP0KAD1_9DINO